LKQAKYIHAHISLKKLSCPANLDLGSSIRIQQGESETVRFSVFFNAGVNGKTFD
jgi:hypothetical protein